MHPFSRSTALGAATLLVAGAALAGAGTAQANPPHRTVVADGLLGPLSVGVRANGTAFVAETGRLVKIRPGHAPRTVYQARKGWSPGAVSVAAKQVTFSVVKEGEPASEHSRILHLAGGHVTSFANTGAFERNNNPDAGVTYGFRHLDKRCLAKVSAGPAPPRYQGVVDTNPYGTALAGSTTYVADAAGNDILRINRHGHIKLVKVIRPVPLLVTKHRAKLNHVPKCAIGHRYWSEAVPTDVEVDGSGNLVISTLTGFTLAPGFGGQSRVYRYSPGTGHLTLVAKRLNGAVGLAIAADGSYLVSQLGGNEVSRVDANTGAVSHYRKVSQPAAVERVRGKVYVTARVLARKPVGRLLRFPS